MSNTLITFTYEVTTSATKKGRAASTLAALLYCKSNELLLCHKLFVFDLFQVGRVGFGSH